MIPSDYVLVRLTPIEDFNAKFVGVRYVVDAGTRQERSYSFTAAQVLRTGFTVPGTDYPMSAILGVLHPLPPGAHTVDVFWTLSAFLF